MAVVWTYREGVDAAVPGVEALRLGYDPDTGQYTFGGRPFTGASKARDPAGRLIGLTQYRAGVADGVSVYWHPNGQLAQYAEVRGGVFHGVRLRWTADGRPEPGERYRDGELVAEPTG